MARDKALSVWSHYGDVIMGRRWEKTLKLRVAAPYAGNSPGTGEFPAQMISNAENVSIWWRHHEDIDIVRPRIIGCLMTVV